VSTCTLLRPHGPATAERAFKAFVGLRKLLIRAARTGTQDLLLGRTQRAATELGQSSDIFKATILQQTNKLDD
jgi:hypothetical protein